MQSITHGTQSRSWKSLLLGTVTALLLVPVPAYATFTLGSWSVTPGSGWAVGAGSGGKDLFIIPQSGFLTGDTTIDFTAPVLTNDGTNGVNIVSTPGYQHFDTIQNINAGSGGGLQIIIGFLKPGNTDPAANNTIVPAGNQFTGTLPPTITGSNININKNEVDTALVRFVWTGVGTNWSVPSTPTPIHITFTP
jgi:hypothetical protein